MPHSTSVFATGIDKYKHMAQGIQRLTLTFLQLGALATAITLLQTMEVAAKFPAVVKPFSMALVALALMRGLALRILVTRYEPGSGKMAQLIGAMQRGRAKGIAQISPAVAMTAGAVLLLLLSIFKRPSYLDRIHLLPVAESIRIALCLLMRNSAEVV